MFGFNNIIKLITRKGNEMKEKGKRNGGATEREGKKERRRAPSKMFLAEFV